jgi:hypothetical protein
MNTPHVQGFLKEPKANASGGVYRGQFKCDEVQWTGSDSDLLASFTISERK